ncbi:MAG: 3-hydroxyacyl-CoA dehydrogenase NAD-binding domain-containing protein [Gammaproteobacteria bacterium]|jgi:3-hydroxybutyryl-CoA dehydrogenase|nr:3-hydroxyacyl-CoA dehydrogenase NAD-binding domain-containing protein [Gammaproteobacteria bacterium]
MTSSVAVIGAGLMGNGIAQLMASHGMNVMLYEPFGDARQQARDKILSICSAIGDPADCVDRISFTGDLEEAVASVGFVIEAVPEKIALKQELFAKLASFTPAGTLLGSNSSVIPISTIAGELDDTQAARVVGVHFWNPPYLVPLVEVIQGERTALESVEAAMELLRAAGKDPVHIRKDTVVGNRLQHALWREAVALVASGAIDPAGVDTVIKKSFGLRLPVLGPLENADLVGIELTQDVHRVVFPELCNDAEPNLILQQMLDSGRTGMNSGKGFYDWTPESAAAKRELLTTHLLKVTGRT